MSFGNPQVLLAANSSNIKATPPGPAPAGIAFVGNFSSGDLRQYALLQSENAVEVGGIWQDPTRVFMMNDTPPPGESWYAHLVCDDADQVAGAANPRCQLVSPSFALPGQVIKYTGWFRMTYLPVVSASQFFLVMEIFGPPFYASPQISLTIDQNGNVALASEQRFTPPYFYSFWTTPLVLNVWNHFTIITYLSPDPTQGWIELYFSDDGTGNDQKQTLNFQGRNYNHLFPIQTMNVDTTTNPYTDAQFANFYPDLYRSRGLESVSMCDHAGYYAYLLQSS